MGKFPRLYSVEYINGNNALFQGQEGAGSSNLLFVSVLDA